MNSLINIKYTTNTLLVIALLQLTGCSKFIDIDAPDNTVNTENVYASDNNAIAVLTGLYTNIALDNSALASVGSGLPFMSVYAGLSADELTLYPSTTDLELIGYYTNELRTENVLTTNFWSKPYKHIFVINAAIEGLSASTTLTSGVKQQLLGEAHFMRAFCYFYLTNLYGEVPLVLSTDYSITSVQPKTEIPVIYEQIKADLKQAQNLLSNNYLNGTLKGTSEDRVRPNIAAATALLSRVYLYNNDYVNAEAEATKIISDLGNYNLAPIDEVFTKNSKETIWALQPVGAFTDQNTGEGKLFILPAEGPQEYANQTYLSDQLLKVFDNRDQRYHKWCDSVEVSGEVYHYAYKYKIGVQEIPTEEYPIILRVAEQYLIRAEARIQQNNIEGGITDLNLIRKRATDQTASSEKQLPQLSVAITKTVALNAVEKERQTELFTEWGHRWLDLKRTNRIDAVMSVVSPLKGGTWHSYSALYPIPLRDIQNNPNLRQNIGY